MEYLTIQENLASQITKLKINFKKSSKERRTKTFVETRLENLESKFEEFNKNHLEIVKRKETLNTDYFNNDLYSEVEEYFLEFKTELKELLNDFTDPADNAISMKDIGNDASYVKTGCNKAVKLPRIVIPKFSGDYAEWITFRDLFTSLIDKNEDIDNVQKLQYLKGHLTGEAEQLLRHIPIANNGYQQGWTLLNERYNNKQYLVNCIFKRFFSLKPISIESSSCIKSFLDSINDMINGLSNLDINTESWDVLIIYIMSQKLDVESRKMWESKVSTITNHSNVLPSLTKFKDFLETRYHSLEFLDSKFSKTKSYNNSKSSCVNLHVSSNQHDTNKVCECCNSSPHKILYCNKFKELSVNDKRDFVQHHRLCFNCLLYSHVAKHCRSRTSCQICKRRHHTLLHQSVQTAAVEEATVEKELKGETNQGNQGSEVGGSYFSKGMGNDSLLGTAIVNAESGSRSGMITLRALIDPGSHVSFITEAAAQLLGLKRKTSREQFVGLGGMPTLTAKSMAEVTLHSINNSDCHIRMEVFILEKLTALLPPREVTLQAWPSLDDLCLADRDFSRPSKIDILIGADEYSYILKEGLRRIHPGH